MPLWLLLVASFCHLAPLIVPLSWIFSLVVIILLPASLVLRLSILELMYTDVWCPSESLLDKCCPLNVWSDPEVLLSSDGRISCPLPLSTGKGRPIGNTNHWSACLTSLAMLIEVWPVVFSPILTALVDAWPAVLSSPLDRKRTSRSMALSTSVTLVFCCDNR